ncbi:SET domain-containing [Paramuricea clavata]|uniref:SET domain-containing n=1 Tax=Paramuricea clavata TaxID=317549 RepID=A0A6S7G155_PARCT|nr:SET domain-containing [Paramuricea clavata]
MSHFNERFLNRRQYREIYGWRPPRVQSKRKSQRCVSNTVHDVQCRKRTAHTKKCWVHLAKQDNLRIKPSQIPNAGKGLYAWKKPIPRGRIISQYTGRKRTRQQIDRKYGDATAQYTICNRRGRCIDANHTTDGAARFVNDARNSRFQNNSRIKGRSAFRLKATSTIQPHQEIFTNYGRDYWL